MSGMNGRFPRTLQQAFGPYTHEYIYDDDEKKKVWIWPVVSFVATLAMLVIVI